MIGASVQLPTATVKGAKALFFDRGAVVSRLDAAERRVFSRFGAFVRSDARRSMRRTKSGKPSKPGRPPRVDVGFLKEFLYFIYEPREHEVLIGPVLLAGSGSSTPVPGLHEHGGTRRFPGGFSVRYPARPYMKPAFNKNLKVIQEFRNSIVN